MSGKTVYLFSLLVFLLSCAPCVPNRAAAQLNGTTHDELKPLDPNDPQLTFSFPIRPGEKPFRFKVNLDKAGSVADVSIFHEGVSTPFQTLKACGRAGLTEPINEDWGGYYISNLLGHADLNFDGFEDLELLDYAIPHLDKKIYCIYLWDEKASLFRYSKELTDISVNLEAHPESKTLTVSEDWQGGAWHESTYRWKGGKLELIEENSLLGDWSLQEDGKCGFEYTCSRPIKGKMVITLEKPVCTSEEMDNLPDCPVADATPAPKMPSERPVVEKNN